MQPLLTGDPQRAGDYRLVARLGRGAMGGVYLGRSKGGRMVAVKVVRPDLAEDPEFRERFRREVDMARSVGGFWTAAVVDADPDAETPWLATEYVAGPTLHGAVAEHGPLPEPTVRALGAGLAEALTAIHRRGLVHRDLKPGNVLLAQDGPRVIDFGISRAMTGSTLTATGMFLGTPGFFSPEQTTGEKVGPASDVFSLGTVLVFAAAGHGPFEADNTAALLYHLAHGEPDLAGVPDELRPLLAACLSKDPHVRPSPEAIVAQLGDLHSGQDWLPAALTAAVADHATRSRQVAAAGSDAQAANPHAAVASSPAGAAGAAGAAGGEGAAPSPEAARGDWQAAPARPATKRQPVPERKAPEPAERSHPPAPAVRAHEPGPVFRTAGRASSLLTALLCGLCLYVVLWSARHNGVLPEVRPLLTAGVALLALAAVVSALSVFVPRLRMKINADGVVLSRGGLRRCIPWAQVRHVAIVGRGKQQAVAVWFADGVALPRTRLWHRVRPYQGGARVFPLGATGWWWARRQQAKRMRSALHQYAPGRYDARLR
ncbi:hypothetical protein GCM10027174_23500 [Salinifilum aidingensis]